MDKSEFGIGIFFDQSKAFDIIDHQLLLIKLEKFGIRGSTHKLSSSYLNSRFSCTNVGNTKSAFKLVKIGVPQGSVLGPLLFLFFTNDALTLKTNCTKIAFVDDMSLYFFGINLTNLINTTNNVINIFINWFSSNKLLLNHSKTSAMLFRHFRKTVPSNLPQILIDYSS